MQWFKRKPRKPRPPDYDRIMRDLISVAAITHHSYSYTVQKYLWWLDDNDPEMAAGFREYLDGPR